VQIVLHFLGPDASDPLDEFVKKAGIHCDG
jgi:hypothetical protein